MEAVYALPDLFERRRVLIEQGREYLAGRGADTDARSRCAPSILAARRSEAISGLPRRHFGASTGHRIASDRRSRVSEGYE